MLIAIISVVLTIVLFLCAFIGFTQGLRLGMTVAKGNIPTPIRNPLQVVEDTIASAKNKKANEEEQEQIDSMFSYNGDIPKGEN